MKSEDKSIIRAMIIMVIASYGAGLAQNRVVTYIAVPVAVLAACYIAYAMYKEYKQ